MYTGNHVRDNRLGKIAFTIGVITSSDADIKKSLHLVFSKFIPWRMEENFIENRVTITGCCEEFSEVKENEQIPKYEIVFYNDDGEIGIKEWKKL